eukprot:145400-Pelagomonas_calceolata.AAC.6
MSCTCGFWKRCPHAVEYRAFLKVPGGPKAFREGVQLDVQAALSLKTKGFVIWLRFDMSEFAAPQAH